MIYLFVYFDCILITLIYISRYLPSWYNKSPQIRSFATIPLIGACCICLGTFATNGILLFIFDFVLIVWFEFSRYLRFWLKKPDQTPSTRFWLDFFEPIPSHMPAMLALDLSTFIDWLFCCVIVKDCVSSGHCPVSSADWFLFLSLIDSV